jgi:hypothetical protein
VQRVKQVSEEVLDVPDDRIASGWLDTDDGLIPSQSVTFQNRDKMRFE